MCRISTLSRLASRFRGVAVVVAVVWLCRDVAFAQKYQLDEPATDTRVYRVQQRMQLTGTLKTPLGDDKTLPLKMTGTAKHAFREIRLSGTGRDAKAFRVLRNYREADATVTVGGQQSRQRLRSTLRLMVVQGGNSGISLYSPSGPLDYSDVELLRMPGDSLSLLALLPPGKVAVGQTWAASSWAVQMMTGIHAVSKADLACKLKSVADDKAVIGFDGKAEGARDGAPTEITLKGEITYDLKRKHIAKLTLKQTETSRAGPVSPALDVTAKVTMHREITENAGPLSARGAGRIPLEPKPELLRVRFSPRPGIEFFISSDWHLFHQSRELSILRLVQEGNLVAQVTIRRLKTAAPGKHVPEEKFQRDIAASLGKRLKEIKKAEQIKLKGRDDDGRFLYRVIAEGSDNDIAMQWRYYLCAAASGRQVSLVFAVEKKLIEQFSDADLGFVLGVRFTKPSERR